MRIEGAIYNYLNSNLMPKKRNTTHKSSELKEVYNSMVRYNRNSPLYLVSLSDAKQEYMINIKEAALTLKDVTEGFASEDSDLYKRRVLISDDESSISGSIVRGGNNRLPESLTVSLKSLATEQVNTGVYIRSGSKNIEAGAYSFILSTGRGNSRFSVSVSADDTNLDVQQRISDYVNNRNIGVTASVISEGNNSSLMLSSDDTGTPSTDNGLFFTISDDGNKTGLTKLLGLDNVSRYPSDSVFYINEERHTASSNHISVNQAIELDFHKPSDNEVHINLIPDSELAAKQVDMFVDAYNSLVSMSDAEQKVDIGSRNLFNDISGIVTKHKDELEQAGFLINEDNSLKKDDSLLHTNISNGSFTNLFNSMSSLYKDIEAASNRLTLDPLAYVNKLMVTYPNSRNKLSTTYTKSLYSGLMFNNYV